MTSALRPYSPDDADACMDVWSRASRLAHPFIPGEGEGERARITREDYLPNAEIWVAAGEGGRVLGFVALLGDELGGLFVDPRVQGEGLGRRLVEHAASLRGALYLEVFEENTRARGFYAAMGFRETGRRVDEQTGHVLLRAERPAPHG